MPWNLNMIFSKIFENIWHWEHSRGVAHLPTRVEGMPYPLGTPPASWAHGGPPPLIPAPIFFLYLTHTRKTNSSTCSSHFCCDFRSPCSKHLSQNCLGRLFLGSDSSIGPISFCSSALFIANFCCLGDSVLELSCQIYMVKSSFDAWYRP